jgi:hypothetical protein
MFPNRIVTELGMGRCEPAVGDWFAPRTPRQRAPIPACRSLVPINLLGGAIVVPARVSGIPCSSRSRAFVISARPNCRGFGPGPSLNVPITEHTL